MNAQVNIVFTRVCAECDDKLCHRPAHPGDQNTVDLKRFILLLRAPYFPAACEFRIVLRCVMGRFGHRSLADSSDMKERLQRRPPELDEPLIRLDEDEGLSPEETQLVRNTRSSRAVLIPPHQFHVPLANTRHCNWK